MRPPSGLVGGERYNMNKKYAIRKALNSARYGTDSIVYHWTDDPGNPGSNDYHVVSLSDYHCDMSAAWIPEYSVVFCTEGW